MKNKEFHKLLKKNKFKANTGFTLTELLVALIMSTFVIGALGFGLMQILRTTRTEGSRTAARNETSRALDFISDEMRRAQAIEVDNSDLSAVATDFEAPLGGTARLALQLPGVPQRIIYSVGDKITPWKGPKVIYRWGPELGADGEYTAASLANPSSWTNEALVDKVSDESQTQACGGQDVSYEGFFACIIDDDGDAIVEDAADENGDGVITFADDPADVDDDGKYSFGDTLTDVNGDGTIDFKDSTWDKNKDGKINAADRADIDGQAITAQLYFTGGTIAADGSAKTYSADTQTVARARNAPDSNSSSFNSYIMSYKTLGAVYGCEPATPTSWEMRTDFINNPSDPNNEAGNSNKKWVHNDTIDAQPQPIKIDTSQNLEISSIPVNRQNCISRGGDSAVNGQTYGNNNIAGEDDSIYYQDSKGNYTLADGTTPLPTGQNPIAKADIHRVSHTVDFDDPATYNGYEADNMNVGDGTVVFLRRGTTIPGNAGYDPDDNSTTNNNQESLGEFLYSKGYADVAGDDYVVNDKLDVNERIVAFEVGQESTATDQPGFDLQDNIFILTSDVFSKNKSDSSTVLEN